MTRLPEGKTRLDLVREAALNPSTGADNLTIKRGRMVVSIDRLAEDAANERKTFRAMEGLIESIKSVGLIEPITVSAEPDGKLRIVTGHRRYRAARAAGLAQVEVIVRDPEDERTRRLKSVISNVQREDVGAVEMAEALQSMLDDGHANSQSALAQSIGKSKQWVSDLLAVLSLSTPMLDAVRRSARPISYDTMSKIARVKEEKTQAELIDVALAGGTVRDLRERVNAARGKPAKAVAGELPKPKRVFRTDHQLTVIVQSETSDITATAVTAALRDALEQAIRFAA